MTDIIAFDYGHPDLETIKLQALQKALQAARVKSDVLFDPALFAHRPKLVNIRESQRTIFPASKYQSFSNTIDQVVVLPRRFREDIPRISAPRPQVTFYRGLVMDGDAISSRLPMSPEISVVSRVRLYYESPFVEPPDDDDD